MDPHLVTIVFSATSLSAPISGVIIGGIIITKLGGYNTKKSQKLLILVGSMAIICAIPVPLLQSYVPVCALLWWLLFFGGFCVPPLTGIMINSVPAKQKTAANSISNLLQNLLGYLPAPGLYGFVASMTSTLRIPMGMLMYSTIFTVLVLTYGINKKLKNEERNESHAPSVDTISKHEQKNQSQK